MKAPDFDYVCAADLAQAFDALEAYGGDAQILAGGQSLMATLNLRLSAPACLIDINRIAALRGIREQTDGALEIGACTRHAEIDDPRIAHGAPLLAKALAHVAHPAIRNRGTIGGSVALADPAAEWPACLVALGAEIVLARRGGERTLAAEDFFLDLYETARAPDEIVTAIRLPRRERRRSGFAEISRREGDFAIVGVAATAVVADGAFADLRLVVFGCESHPRIAPSAATAAHALPVEEASFARIVDALDADIRPFGNLQGAAPFKRHLARVLCARVLREIADEGVA